MARRAGAWVPRPPRRRSGVNAGRHDAPALPRSLPQSCSPEGQASSGPPFERCCVPRDGGDLMAVGRGRAPPRAMAGGVDDGSSGPLAAEGSLRQTPRGLHGRSPPTPRLHPQRIGGTCRLCRGVRRSRRRREALGSCSRTNEDGPSEARCDAGEARTRSTAPNDHETTFGDGGRRDGQERLPPGRHRAP